jgi:hypothetical protein
MASPLKTGFTGSAPFAATCEAAKGARSGRFVLLRCFDERWAIIDTEAEFAVVVYCPDEDEARAMLAALNIKVPRRTRRASTKPAAFLPIIDP